MVLCIPTRGLCLRADTRRISVRTNFGTKPFFAYESVQMSLRLTSTFACSRVFPIPDGLPTNKAAPMLCAGLTAYSPLVRNGCGPGKRVGIVGLGGIGVSEQGVKRLLFCLTEEF